jgi:hypothetical protein
MSSVPMSIDFDRLLKLRLVVARFGELDQAKWWNSKGQLGRLGSLSLRRGFPRTYRFAQARSVFAIASHRCSAVFEPSGCVTLWRLPDSIEEAFDARWEHWLDNADEWTGFFEKLDALPGTNLSHILRFFELVDSSDLDAFQKLERSADTPSVLLPERFSGTNPEIALLALGFAHGQPGELVVPYATKANT